MAQRFNKVAFAVALLAAAGREALAGKATIAVGRIVNKADTMTGTEKRHHSYGRRTLPEKTRAFVDMITSALVKTRKFEVVERERIDEALKEQALGEMEMTESATAQRFGKLIGVDYILIGTITQFSEDVKEVAAGSFTMKKSVARMAIDIRVIDASTGSIKLAESVVQTAQGAAGFSSGQFATASESKGVLGDVMRACADQVVSLIVGAVYPVKIVKLTGNNVVLNYGRGFLSSGDTLDVFALGEAMVDPDTGETLGQEEEKVGTIRVTNVQAKFSRGEILQGADRMERGMVCRKRPKSSPQKERKKKVEVPW